MQDYYLAWSNIIILFVVTFIMMMGISNVFLGMIFGFCLYHFIFFNDDLMGLD